MKKDTLRIVVVLTAMLFCVGQIEAGTIVMVVSYMPETSVGLDNIVIKAVP